MAGFEFTCPLKPPVKCELPASDIDHLEGEEKYKAFFMYQFDEQDDYLVEAIETSFSGPEYRVFNAAKEPATGVKLCKICRLALASNFGIACLSPMNLNVFQEVGLMLGMEKPVLYLVNPNQLRNGRIKDLPFDLQQEILIVFRTKEELDNGLAREKGQFLKKVQIYTHFVLEFRNSIKERIEQLDEHKLNILKCLAIEGRRISLHRITNRLNMSGISTEVREVEVGLDQLYARGIIDRATNTQEQPSIMNFWIPQNFEKVVQDEIFK